MRKKHDSIKGACKIISGLKPVQIIFSITRHCPYECEFCAMDASNKHRTNYHAVITAAKNLARFIKKNPDCKIDLSGGDPLSPDALPATLECLEILGRERCSISTTGYYLNEKILDKLKGISGLDFTVDAPSQTKGIEDRRPKGYHDLGHRAIKRCVELGIPVAVSTVLTNSTSSGENLKAIQAELELLGVSFWVWIPLFRTGRATISNTRQSNIPPEDLLKKLTPEEIQPKLQHTLQGCNCHAKKEVLYVSPEGLLSACPWALDDDGFPHHEFILGDLTEESADIILARPWRSENCPALWTNTAIAA